MVYPLGDCRVVKTVDAVGGVTAYTYDQLGRVASVSDPASGTSTFEYSLAGQQSAAVDASGARTEATWDFLGRPLTGTQISRQAGQGFTTGYSYATSGATATVNELGKHTIHGHTMAIQVTPAFVRIR